jgi:hypothetical protein
MIEYDERSQNPPAWWVGTSPQTEARLDANYYQPRFLRNAVELESCGLPIEFLKDAVAKVNCGATPKNVKYGDTGAALVRGAEIRPNYFDDSQLGRVPGLTIKENSNLCVLPGDVLYTMSGVNVGMCATYPKHLPPATFSNTVARARTGSFLDPFYLCLFLNSRLGFSQTLRLISGAVQGHVMPNPFKRFRIPVPNSDIPRAIGNKVRKAERLRELAERAEKGNRALFHELFGTAPKTAQDSLSWVKPFDLQIRLDSDYYSPAIVLIRRLLRERYRPIPLSEVIEQMDTGGTPQATNASEGFLFVPSAAVSSDRLNVKQTGRISLDDHAQLKESEARPRDILLAKDGNTIGHLAVVPEWVEKASINEHTYRLRLSNPRAAVWIHLWLTSSWGRPQLLAEAVGSAQAGLTRDFTDNVLVVLPEESVLLQTDRNGMDALAHWHNADDLIDSAKSDVESLIGGALDQDRLLAESAEIEAWLQKNPSPNAADKARVEVGEE